MRTGIAAALGVCWWPRVTPAQFGVTVILSFDNYALLWADAWWEALNALTAGIKHWFLYIFQYIEAAVWKGLPAEDIKGVFILSPKNLGVRLCLSEKDQDISLSFRAEYLLTFQYFCQIKYI